MTVQQQYDSLDKQAEGRILLKIVKTAKEAPNTGPAGLRRPGRVGEPRLKRYWSRNKA